MLKNNIKSLGCLIIVIFILKSFMRYKIGEYSVIETLFIGIIFIIIYCSFGFFILENKGSFRINFLSVILLSIVGLIVWGVCFNITDYKFFSRGFGDDGFTSEWWVHHDLMWNYYNVFSMPLKLISLIFQLIILFWNYNEKTPRILDIINLYNAFIPSLFLCIGIELKSRFK